MSRLFVRLILIAVLCSGYAMAGPVVVALGAFSGSTVTVDFLSFASGTLISNQLATSANFGLTFSSTIGGIYANSSYFTDTGVAVSATSFAPSGSTYVDETLTFSSPVIRIGFDLFGSNAGTVTFTDTSGSVALTVGQYPIREFIGIQDVSGITSLTIDAPQNQAFIVDKLELDPGSGTTTPEPGSFALLALGVGGIGFLLRRRGSHMPA